MWDKEVQANNTIPRQYSVSVDVIIPVYKPDTKFNQLIERLTKQTVKPNRIILLQTVETETDSTEKQEKALAYALSLSSSICRIESYEIKNLILTMVEQETTVRPCHRLKLLYL